MDAAKHKAALNALNELMVSELSGEGRDKFARVNRLTVLASKLQMEEPKPEDVSQENQNLEDGAYGFGGIGGGGAMMANPYPIGRVVGAGGDQLQLVHEIVAMAGPHLEAQASAARAQQRKAMASELNELIKARAQLIAIGGEHEQARQLTKRISELTQTFAQEDPDDEKPADNIPAYPDRELRVVHPVDVRGHQARDDRRLLDAGDIGRAIANREAGGAGVIEARAEAERDGGAVGDAG